METYILSRWAEGATRWAISTPTDLRIEASERTAVLLAELRQALKALFFEHHQRFPDGLENWIESYERADELEKKSMGKRPRLSKEWLCEQAIQDLADPDEEFEGGRIAAQILRTHYVPKRLPKPSTMAEDWFGRWTIEQMIGLEPDPESGE